ncbi:MAG: hypothetical protein JXD19_07125 [Deltaproteobacteria bacterium]|nr:hypothetical protein [Deltaproteobacteria bacterium]
MDFYTMLEALKDYDLYEYFDVTDHTKECYIRPKKWVTYIFMTLPFYCAANLKGEDLTGLMYEKVRQNHPELEYANVEQCITQLIAGEDLFAEILYWFLEGGRAEFHKVVYLDSLKNFYKYGRHLKTVLRRREEIERILWEGVDFLGSA